MTIRSIAKGLTVAVLGLLIAAPASAGDSNGNFQAKLGVTGVLTDDDTTRLNLGATNLLATGGYAETNDTVIPSLTLTYFFNKNIAVELFCCFDKVDVEAKGSLAGLGKLADTWIFPPILTLQYHFDPIGRFRPFVGVGAEWVHYFNSKVKAGGAGAPVGATNVEFDDSFGFALQAGVDYDLGGGWSLGVDVKKVWEDTKITWSGGASNLVAEHDIDPLFVTANLGYRFNLEDLLGRPAAPMK